MNSLTHGVKAVIIDFGLSRMNVRKSGSPYSGASRSSRSGGNRGHDSCEEVPQFTEFDEVIFQGEGATMETNSIRIYFLIDLSDTGDYQFDIYRMMRKHNGDDWAKFSPLSNVMVCYVRAYCDWV